MRAGKTVRHFWENERLRPDFALATRGTLGFMIPLVVAFTTRLPFEAAFAALAAQNIAMVDVRGAYGLRLGLLSTMALVLAVSVALGSLVSHHLIAAVILTALMTLASGLWRHISSDYGPPLAISSLLVFFLALAGAEGATVALEHAIAILAGGVLGILLQVAYWPVQPQHPLRRTVAESWLAAADLFSALAPVDPAQRQARHDQVTTAENAFRTAIDHAAVVLIQASARRRPALVNQLEALNLSAARLAVRVSALNTALESCMSEANFAHIAPALLPLLTSLTNTSRTVALAVVSRQPAHFAACEVRLRRAGSLLRVLQSRLRGPAAISACHAQLEEILVALQTLLPDLRSALRDTIARADERAAFSLELFDLSTWMLRPLAATLNFNSQVEPALIRFTLRLTALTTVGVLAFKLLGLPHGYWLPFTMVVVLQPDYGATRQRAAQRVLGTVAGSVAATGLLWVQMPPAALLGAIALCVFIFAYTIRQYYAFGIFFVTVFVVLLMEATGPVTAAVAVERVAATIAGGLLALGAAALFWPLWERQRFPPIMAEALRANADYAEQIGEHLRRGGERKESLVAAKKRAETANAAVFASLKRMFGDPENRREGVEQAAALANGNQRLTRIFNLLFVQVGKSAPAPSAELSEFTPLSTRTLRLLAEGVLHPPEATTLVQLRAALDQLGPGAETDAAKMGTEASWLSVQFGRAATELSAMILALEGEAATPPVAAVAANGF